MKHSSITIDDSGVHVHRSRLAGSLQPDLSVGADQLLGWRVSAPTDSAPGWIHFLIKDANANQFVHSFNESLTIPTSIQFYPGDQEEFMLVDTKLANLQAGYPLEDAEVSVAEWADGVASEKKKLEQAPEQNTTQTSAQSSGAKKNKRRAPWARVATPDEVPEQNKKADVDNPLYGQTVVVTGDVEPHTKGEVWDMIAEAGGSVAKNVTKKTTLLIVGEWATMTSKEKRARELQEQGQELEIWQFEEFLKTLEK